MVLQHSDLSAGEMVNSPSSLLKLAVLLLVSVTSAYPPTCSSYYGKPSAGDCYRLINDNVLGIRYIDQAHHFFGVLAVTRPAEISQAQVSVLTPSLARGPLIVCPVRPQT